MKIRIIILRISKVVLQGVYALMKLRSIRRKVTILSRQSNEPSTDIALLACYLEENHPDLNVKVMCRRFEEGGVFAYGLHMLRQMWNMADSKVVLLDSYCIAASILKHRKDTEVIQMWHSMAAIKQFGYQTLDRPGGRSSDIARALCMHRNYDRVLCPSKATGDHFCRAFDIDGSVLLPMALPRVDLITGPDEKRNELREKYSIDPDKEILLYAPTFRKSDQLKVDELIRNVDRKRFQLVICPHPLDESPCLDTLEEEGLTVDRDGETIHWLAVADRVITDYSAVALEAAIGDKPVYFYVYDIEEYSRSEGLNVDPRTEVPGITAIDSHELAELLDREYPFDELVRFRDKYFEVETENSTSKLGEYIYGLSEKKH